MNPLSSSDICKLFGMSKSTLFRWEEQDSFPPIERTASDARQYSLEIVHWLANDLRERHGKQYSQAIKRVDQARLGELHREMQRLKFIAGDSTSLYEMIAADEITPQIIHDRLGILLLLYEPGDSFFSEALHVLALAAAPFRSRR